MLESENVSYAKLSRESYIDAVRRGQVQSLEMLKESARAGNLEELGPGVVVKLRQQAKTACHLLLVMEREGVSRENLEECLVVMPASLKLFMEAYFGWRKAGPEEMQACHFLREVFLACAQPHQLKRYVKLVHEFPDLLKETAGILLEEGHYVLALEMYQSVPTGQLSEKDRSHMVGLCAYQSGRFPIAEEQLQRALDLGDESPEIPLFLKWIHESEAKRR